MLLLCVCCCCVFVVAAKGAASIWRCVPLLSAGAAAQVSMSPYKPSAPHQSTGRSTVQNGNLKQSEAQKEFDRKVGGPHHISPPTERRSTPSQPGVPFHHSDWHLSQQGFATVIPSLGICHMTPRGLSAPPPAAPPRVAEAREGDPRAAAGESGRQTGQSRDAGQGRSPHTHPRKGPPPQSPRPRRHEGTLEFLVGRPRHAKPRHELTRHSISAMSGCCRRRRRRCRTPAWIESIGSNHLVGMYSMLCGWVRCTAVDAFAPGTPRITAWSPPAVCC